MQKRETPETPATLSANILSLAQLAVMVKAIVIDKFKKKKSPVIACKEKTCLWAWRKPITPVSVISTAKGC